jgi:hypothetical protein
LAVLTGLAALGQRADVARLTPLGRPTMNLNGRYQTTTRPPTKSR